MKRRAMGWKEGEDFAIEGEKILLASHLEPGAEELLYSVQKGRLDDHDGWFAFHLTGKPVAFDPATDLGDAWRVLARLNGRFETDANIPANICLGALKAGGVDAKK